MGGALIADSFEAAARIAPTVPFPVATIEGDVFRGRHVVTGGDKAESRGILATKREIKELRERIAASNASLEQLIAETAGFEQTIAHATAAIAGLSSEIHRQEKAIVGVEGQAQARRRRRVARAAAHRPRRHRDQPRPGRDRRSRCAAGRSARVDRAAERAEDRGRTALNDAQQRLGAARDTAEGLSLKAGEARAAHAALVERSAARRRRSGAHGRRRGRARAARRIRARATSP